MLRGGEQLSTLVLVKSEIVRIWRLNGVRIVFPGEDARCPGQVGAVIRAYLADGPEVFPEDERPSVRRGTLGAAQGTGERPGPVVYAFIDRADRLLKRGPRLTSRQLRLSLILGRVIAHEMGHVLLRSAAHSDAGLMRRRYGVVDGWLLPPEMYTLTPRERAIVHRHLLESTPMTPPPRAPALRPFSPDAHVRAGRAASTSHRSRRRSRVHASQARRLPCIQLDSSIQAAVLKGPLPTGLAAAAFAIDSADVSCLAREMRGLWHVMCG